MLASQRLSTVALADRAVVLEDGVIVEDGPPRSLLGAGGTFERLFGDEVRVA
jgi:ABC-type multidrug transport system fused ATPase/permease subunit